MALNGKRARNWSEVNITSGVITLGCNGTFKFGEAVGRAVSAQIQDYLLNW